MFAFRFSHPKRGRQANAFKHDEKKQAFTGNWQLNTSLKNTHQPGKAPAPAQKQALACVTSSLRHDRLMGGGHLQTAAVEQGSPGTHYFVAYLEEVKRSDRFSGLEELEGFSVQR